MHQQQQFETKHASKSAAATAVAVTSLRVFRAKRKLLSVKSYSGWITAKSYHRDGRGAVGSRDPPRVLYYVFACVSMMRMCLYAPSRGYIHYISLHSQSAPPSTTIEQAVRSEQPTTVEQAERSEQGLYTRYTIVALAVRDTVHQSRTSIGVHATHSHAAETNFANKSATSATYQHQLLATCSFPHSAPCTFSGTRIVQVFSFIGRLICLAQKLQRLPQWPGGFRYLVPTGCS
ncbi:unnamed protein product [Trichogramma brassicae]|uniref:Uncharacterized protein n=1 Tax=Trichogramma brassicae TaxID=86971 RepID=A0A6H5IK80_9HYME|nr:unnamed protein product [Trichogramma brassicae]